LSFARAEIRFHAAFLPIPGIASSCFSVTESMSKPTSTPVIERAPVPVSDSVQGLIELINEQEHAKTGRFFEYTGEELPW